MDETIFVQYFTHEAAQLAVDMLNGAKFDERIIKVEMDPGYKDGRQWGRGKTGGQASDDHRSKFDSGRGGWGDNKNNNNKKSHNKRRKRRDDRKNGRHRNFSNNNNNFGNYFPEPPKYLRFPRMGAAPAPVRRRQH